MKKHKNQLLNSIKWSFASNWGKDGISALITLILALLLNPADFGLVAIAYVFIAFIQMLVGLGFDTGIIQQKNLKQIQLDTIFWIILFLSFLLFLLSILLSKWWAIINDMPQLALIISTLALAIPLEGLSVVQYSLVQREMNFKALAFRNNIAVITGGILGISLALAGFGVWSLVCQNIGRVTISTILIWRISDWRPRFKFSLKKVKDLVLFSTTVFLGRLGVYLQGHSDALIMGIFFSPEAVGLYRLADKLMNIPLKLFTRAIHIVSLPHFSNVQTDIYKVKNSLLFCWRLSSLLTIPIMVIIAFNSELIMQTIGEKWGPAAVPLRVLCLIGIGKSLTLFSGTLLQAIGKANIQAFLAWSSAICNTLLFTAVGLSFGENLVNQQIFWIAISKTFLFIFIFAPINIYIASRIAIIKVKDIILTLTPSLGISLIAVTTILTIKTMISEFYIKPIYELLILGFLAMVICITIVTILDKNFRNLIVSQIRLLKKIIM